MEIDLANPRENDGKIGFHPRERSWLDRMVLSGFQDVWRQANPNVRDQYSWWAAITKARDRNV